MTHTEIRERQLSRRRMFAALAVAGVLALVSCSSDSDGSAGTTIDGVGGDSSSTSSATATSQEGCDLSASGFVTYTIDCKDGTWMVEALIRGDIDARGVAEGELLRRELPGIGGQWSWARVVRDPDADPLESFTIVHVDGSTSEPRPAATVFRDAADGGTSDVEAWIAAYGDGVDRDGDLETYWLYEDPGVGVDGIKVTLADGRSLTLMAEDLGLSRSGGS